MLNYLQIQRKKWNDANPEKRLEYSAKHRRNNLDKVRETCRNSTAKWYRNNRDKAREATPRCRDRNREKVRQQQQRWRDRNRDQIRKKRQVYTANRFATDEQFKLRHYLRSRLRTAMNRGKKAAPKAGSAIRDLGCTIKELWEHLESQFQPGMTRENWGKAWEVDHFYPLNQADLTDRAQFLAVNNWQNLRPMTPAENDAKDDKVYPEAKVLFGRLCAEFREQVAA